MYANFNMIRKISVGFTFKYAYIHEVFANSSYMKLAYLHWPHTVIQMLFYFSSMIGAVYMGGINFIICSYARLMNVIDKKYGNLKNKCLNNIIKNTKKYSA